MKYAAGLLYQNILY